MTIERMANVIAQAIELNGCGATPTRLSVLLERLLGRKPSFEEIAIALDYMRLTNAIEVEVRPKSIAYKLPTQRRNPS